MIVLKAARWADVDTGEIHSPAVIVVEGNRITAVNPVGLLLDSSSVIDLGEVTLLPGLMDMELNLLIGGPGSPEGLPTPMHGVQDDPAYRTLRGAVNAKTTLDAGFTTVRNLGLMVKTGGYLLDVALQRAIDQGWHPGPRICPSSPYFRVVRPSGFSASASAASQIRLTVSSPMVGLNGGGSDMEAGYPAPRASPARNRGTRNRQRTDRKDP